MADDHKKFTVWRSLASRDGEPAAVGISLSRRSHRGNGRWKHVGVSLSQAELRELIGKLTGMLEKPDA